MRLKEQTSAVETAARLGVSRQMIYRYIAGEQPSLEVIERIGGKVTFEERNT